MSGIQVPVDEVSQPWWDATRRRRLLLQHCRECDAVQHHPRYLCLSCGAWAGLDWIEATGAGRLDCYTVVHRGAAPHFEAPYVVARIRLAEGPILLTSLVEVPETDLAAGTPVRLGWRPLPDGRHLPVFAPTTGS